MICTKQHCLFNVIGILISHCSIDGNNKSKSGPSGHWNTRYFYHLEHGSWEEYKAPIQIQVDSNYQVIWCSLNSPFLYCFVFPCSCTQLILGVRAPRQRWSSPSCGTFRVKGSTQLNSKQASEVWISVCIWCLDRCTVREKDVQACLFSTASDLITDIRTVTFFFFFSCSEGLLTYLSHNFALTPTPFRK